MSDTDKLKSNIIQSVLDRKFTKANADFGDLMKNKTYAAIDDFKSAFKYVSIAKQPEETSSETPEAPAKEEG